jgi:hypothetical protein
MNSMAFSLLANSSAEVNKNQEKELTIGSLSIFIGPSGSSRLSDSMKPDPSASKSETVVMLESSEGSSSEINSLVSLGEAKNHRRRQYSGKTRLGRNNAQNAQQYKGLCRWK